MRYVTCDMITYEKKLKMNSFDQENKLKIKAIVEAEKKETRFFGVTDNRFWLSLLSILAHKRVFSLC